MNWHTRITQARTAKNLKKSDLAKLIGVSPATITMWESGQTKKIEGQNLLAVCQILDINPGWLMGKLDLEDRHRSGVLDSLAGHSNLSTIRAINIVQFHFDPDAPHFELEQEYEDGVPSQVGVREQWLGQKRIDPEKLVAIRIVGASMEPALHDGDIATINRARTALADGAVFAVNYERSVVIKRLVRDAGEWWLTSDHVDQRKYGRKIYREGESEIIGRVVLKVTEKI